MLEVLIPLSIPLISFLIGYLIGRMKPKKLDEEDYEALERDAEERLKELER